MDSDEALLSRVAAGDMRAFDVLYDRLERPLFGFVRARLGDAAEAEDVLQETFVAVLRQRDGVRNVRAWLFQVAANLCLNRLRSRKRAGRALEAVAHEPPPEAPEAPFVVRERDRELACAVERLPPALAEVYHLRVSGLSYEEVASAMDVPLGTVKSRMHEVVRRLREEMER